jgi:molybdenum cofactor cytidylyltransferase
MVTQTNGRPLVLVLAAGRGTRFRGKGHKLEQSLGADTVLERTLATVMATGLPMVVVSSAQLAPAARRLVASRDVVVMPEHDARGRPEPMGMGHSIAAGVAATGDASGWLIVPADMPLLQPHSILAVAAALGQNPVVYAQYRGQRGHPVGFNAELFSELVGLQGDEGARRILARYPSLGLELDDPGVLMDLDTEADLERLRAHDAPVPASEPDPELSADSSRR